MPEFLGGSATKPVNEIPPGAKGMLELGKDLYKLEESDVRRLMEPMNHLIKLPKPHNENNNGEVTQYDFIEEFD